MIMMILIFGIQLRATAKFKKLNLRVFSGEERAYIKNPIMQLCCGPLQRVFYKNCPPIDCLSIKILSPHLLSFLRYNTWTWQTFGQIDRRTHGRRTSTGFPCRADQGYI